MGAQLQSGKGGGVTPNINVTPLVDVVLVLLIIFMLVIPNVQNEGKPIEMVNVFNAEKKEDKRDPFIITFAADKTFAVEDREVTREQMMNELRELHASDPKRKILVRGDARLHYKDIRDSFHEIQNMGFGGVALAVGQQREWNDMGQK